MQLIEKHPPETPLFSVCIPQYNRTSFLLKSLQSFQEQKMRDFEVCISDGGSNDGRHQEVIDFLQASSLSFRYTRSSENLRYDANLRSSIALARGRYCLLFGNDDMPASAGSLEQLKEQVLLHSHPEVVIPNFRELTTGTEVRRIRNSGILGSGPEAAVQYFRNFSFVSGILLGRDGAQKHATGEWDGSEMYQMFLGCRMLAEGGRLLGIDQVLVHKDIQIPGEQVDSYARKPTTYTRWVEERRLPLCQYGRVALGALSPFVRPDQKERYARRIFRQVLMFTYPPWLLEYRRVQSWRFAAGVALGMRPRNLLRQAKLGWETRLYLSCIYILVSIVGLSMPKRLFEMLRAHLYTIAKTSA